MASLWDVNWPELSIGVSPENAPEANVGQLLIKPASSSRPVIPQGEKSHRSFLAAFLVEQEGDMVNLVVVTYKNSRYRYTY
jgi:hypothetical protein